MKFTIVVSKQDIAGLNVAQILIEEFGFKQTNETFDGNPIYSKGSYEIIFGNNDIIFIDNVRRPSDVYIFASRHKSESEIPCLTVHPTGNFSNDTSHGGRAKELSPTHSFLMKKALLLLKEIAEKENLIRTYSVSYEVTHHGPTDMDKPSFFIEVGSSEKQWRDKKACECVADVIMSLHHEIGSGYMSSIGFGGPHYAPVFTKKALQTDFALGHMCPKYASRYIDSDLTKQMISKTFPRPEVALIDWKGLKAELRNKIVEHLRKLNLEIVRV